MVVLVILLFISAGYLVEASPRITEREFPPNEINWLNEPVNVLLRENDRHIIRTVCTELLKLLHNKKFAFLYLKFFNALKDVDENNAESERSFIKRFEYDVMTRGLHEAFIHFLVDLIEAQINIKKKILNKLSGTTASSVTTVSSSTASSDTEIPSSSTTESSTAIPSSAAIPSSTSIPSSAAIPSSTAIPSSAAIPSSTAIPSDTTTPSNPIVPSSTTTALPQTTDGSVFKYKEKF